MDAYKTNVELVMPWHDKINVMAKEFVFFSSQAKHSFEPACFQHFEGVGTIGVNEDVVGAFLWYLRTKNGPPETTDNRKCSYLKNLWWQTKAGLRQALLGHECPCVFRARGDKSLKLARLFSKWSKEDQKATPCKAFLTDDQVQQFCLEAIWYHMKVA